MADTEIADLTELTSVASADLLPIVDVSDTTTSGDAGGTTKRATVANLATAVIATTTDLAAIEALTTTSFGRALLALADAAALRTAAALGTIATQAASSVTITGGTVTGITDLAVADGGTGASTAADARTNLGLAIGTDVAAQSSLASYQPLDSDLTAIAALSTTSFGRGLLALVDAAALRTAAGLVIGTDVQAQDAELSAIAGLTSAADRLPYFTGSGTAGLADLTAAGRALIDDADADAQLATLAAVDRENGGLETVSSPSISSNALTLNLANGNVFTVSHNANITTLTLSGATNGRMCSLSLRLTQDATGGRTITWPAAVKWPSATAPTLTTTANAVNWVELWTVDGGTTWFGSGVGAGFA